MHTLEGKIVKTTKNGYGFVKVDGSPISYFLHANDVQNFTGEFTDLLGLRVRFTEAAGERGLAALNATLLDPVPTPPAPAPQVLVTFDTIGGERQVNETLKRIIDDPHSMPTTEALRVMAAAILAVSNQSTRGAPGMTTIIEKPISI